MRRKAFLFPILCLAFLTMASCSKDSLQSVSGDLPFTVTTPETKVSIDNTDQDIIYVHFISPSDIDGCVFFCLNFKGLDPALFFYLKEKSMKAGAEPEIERLDFGIFYSSDSRNYSSVIQKGHIYVKERERDRIVLRFKNVCFKIGAGEFIYNGDVTFPRHSGEY
ncbi:MAG: hypothetical protein J5374_11395 [Bacteroidales bacterium]|nr:hypothetical protein [Bacteroidales bacterium]